MTRFRAQLEPLAQEVENNDRLRFGLYLILAIGITWLSLLLADANAELEREFINLRESHREVIGLGDENLWQQRYAEQSDVAETLQARLWTASTENQTLASIQSTLRKLTADAGLVKPSVLIGTPQWRSEALALKQVRTRVRGTFKADVALELVTRIEDFEPVLAVESLSIEIIRGHATRGNRFNMDVVAYYKVEGSAGD